MQRKLPPWAMGLSMSPLGFYFGYVSTALPILLSARGVSVGEIASVSAIAFSPTFWAFALSPILDVRFSKRAYAFFFVAIAAICLVGSTFLLGNLTAFTAVVATGCTAVVLFGNAVGGWLADVIEDKHYNNVGAWSNVANLGAAGVYSTITVVLIRKLSPTWTSVLLTVILLLPTILLLFIPMPARATRAIGEAFGTLVSDVKHVCKRPGFLLGLCAFLSPTACFALTNLFSGMGEDFHTSEYWVTTINGPAVAVVCSLGCLISIWFCKRFARRTVYVVAGFGGAAAALSLIKMPHTLVFFAIGVLVYNLFQGINYTAFSALSFEITGPNNPFAATQMGLLAAAANFPISYMTKVDGHFHTTHGLTGMFAVDAISSIVVGTILLLVFSKFAPKPVSEPAPAFVAGFRLLAPARYASYW